MRDPRAARAVASEASEGGYPGRPVHEPKDTLLGALWLDLNALETTGIEEATCKTVIAALEKGVQDSACFPRILPGHKLLSKIVERFSHEYYHWNDARKGSRGARQRHTRCNAMRAYKAVRFP